MFSVYFYDKDVGEMERSGRGIRFTYAEAAIENDALPALSVSLPKRRESYPNRQAGPFFRNLLPEQAYKRLVAAAARTAPDDNVALLGAIGGECPGAVSIWPRDRTPPSVHEYQPLNDADLRALFSPSGRIDLGSAIARGRLSLPGVQEKIALLRQNDGTWGLPLNGAVTSHILKHPTDDFPDLLENELFCTALAEKAGIRVPTTGLPSPEVRIFCAQRFDRVPGASTEAPRRKLHQEDFCQVLGVEPDSKYERDGGPGLARCAQVVRRHSSLPAEDLLRIVQWVGFNYLIGNEDAHAKNLAFLYTEHGLRLTPHYDLVSTEVYPQLERSLAMKIGRSWDIRGVQKSDWRRVAERIGLPWDRVRALLSELTAAVANGAQEVMDSCVERFGQAPVYSLVKETVERHAEPMIRELARG